MQAVRNQLHSDYYQNLINRAKAEDEPVTEKLEREEQIAKFEAGVPVYLGDMRTKKEMARPFGVFFHPGQVTYLVEPEERS